MISLKRQFVDGTFGQIHVRVARPEEPERPPLSCLHMSPKSGRIFEAFMQYAASDRIVFAHDYPGFGESARPPVNPEVSVEDYARSLWQVADQLQIEVLDLMGYHTGCLVAAEAARQQPQRVGNIVMLSAPVFTAEELQTAIDTYQAIPLDEAGTRFRIMWERVVQHRGPDMSLESMATSFAENLRGGEAYEWGHRAAFDYAPRYAEVVASLDHDITVINLNDDLHTETPRIADYLRNGEIIDAPNWGHGFLDAHTKDATKTIKAALS